MDEYDSYLLTLAQDGSAAPASGEGTLPPTVGQGLPTETQTGQPQGTAAPPGRDGGIGNEFFMLLLMLFLAIILFSFLGQRRDRKKRQSMINAVKKHDRVQTVGGVIGSIAEVKPDTVVLKVDETSNTRITVARSAIQQVLVNTESEETPSKGSD